MRTETQKFAPIRSDQHTERYVFKIAPLFQTPTNWRDARFAAVPKAKAMCVWSNENSVARVNLLALTLRAHNIHAVPQIAWINIQRRGWTAERQTTTTTIYQPPLHLMAAKRASVSIYRAYYFRLYICSYTKVPSLLTHSLARSHSHKQTHIYVYAESSHNHIAAWKCYKKAIERQAGKSFS